MDFGKWIGVNDSPDQLKRLVSAKKSACTPLSISPKDGAAIFSGSHGTYSTTLESCTCVDFSRRRLPCKHVYRLAIELGVMEGYAVSDASKVKRPTPPGLSVKDAVTTIENIGESAQRALHDVLFSMFYDKKAEAVGVMRSAEISALINSGILVVVDDLRTRLGAYRRNAIRDALISAGFSGFSKNLKLDAMIDWICENAPEVGDLFPDAIGVRLDNSFIKPARKIYTYLNRRNEWETFVDDKGGVHEIPKGSQFVASVNGGSKTELSIEFPDDEITELLDHYGVNRCRGWKP